MSGFIFGGDTGVGDPAELRRRRDMVDQLLQSSMTRAPQTFGEGLAAIGQALAGRISDKRIREQEEMARDKAQGKFSQITGKLMGSPSQRAMAANGGPTRAAANEVEIIQGLVSRGLPEHVAQGFVKNFRDESGLRTDINEIAPVVPGSRGGFGLAQWTGPRRVALEQFAQQRGADVSDINVQLDFLMHELSGPEAKAGQAIMSAQDAPTAADAILRQFLRPAAEHVQTRSARYLGGGGTAMPSSDMVAQLSELAANPYLPEGQRAVVNSMLQTQMQGMDPMRQMQMEQMQLQIEQMRNPPPGYRQVTGAELGLQGDQAGALFNVGPDNKITQIGGAGTNVSVSTGDQIDPRPIVGTPESGIQRRWDEANQTWVDEPIGGGAVERAQIEADEARERQETLTGRQLNPTIDDIITARDLASSGIGRTGMMSGILQRIPFAGQGAVDLSATIDAIGSGISLENLNQMRQASPTGGALGNVSDKQSALLAEAFGSLRQSQSKELFLFNLARVENTLNDIVHGEGNGPQRHDMGALREQLRGSGSPAQPVAPQPRDAPPPPEGISPEDAELWPYFTDEEREIILRLYRQ